MCFLDGPITVHIVGSNKPINYQETLHCTHEVVYPLYSIVFVFYAFSLLFMIILRPFLSSKFLPGRGRNAIYAALYFFPIFALIHGVLGGIIYYSYPYIIIITSLVSCAAHYAFKLDQSVKSLVRTSLTDIRNLVIIAGHWALHAYGIVAVTELKVEWSTRLISKLRKKLFRCMEMLSHSKVAINVSV